MLSIGRQESVESPRTTITLKTDKTGYITSYSDYIAIQLEFNLFEIDSRVSTTLIRLVILPTNSDENSV